MHDIKWIRDNSEAFTKALRSRNWPEAKVEETLAELINLDDRRRQAIMIAQRGQEVQANWASHGQKGYGAGR